MAIPADSFFRSSPVIATLATAVAAISGISLIQQSKVMRPLMRVFSSLPPPPAMLQHLAAAAALAPLSASLIQETLLDSYSPLIVTWVQGGGGWGHAVAGGRGWSGVSLYQNVGIFVWGSAACVLTWLWVEKVYLCVYLSLGVARPSSRMFSLLMPAHLTVLGALHLFIFTTSFFPTTLPTHPPDSPLAPPNNDETQALSAAMAAVVIGWWRVVMDVLWWGTREGLLMMCVALVLSALDSVGQAAQVDITSFLFKVSNINVKIFYLKDVTPIGFRV